MSDSQAIERWLDAYEASWSTGSGVRELFTAHACYFSAPDRPPLVGPAAIELWWIEQGESDTRWVFERRVIATEGVSVADGGRAREFVEYWMLPE